MKFDSDSLILSSRDVVSWVRPAIILSGVHCKTNIESNFVELFMLLSVKQRG